MCTILSSVNTIFHYIFITVSLLREIKIMVLLSVLLFLYDMLNVKVDVVGDGQRSGCFDSDRRRNRTVISPSSMSESRSHALTERILTLFRTSAINKTINSS